MLAKSVKTFRKVILGGALSFLAVSMVALAQEPKADPPATPPPTAQEQTQNPPPATADQPPTAQEEPPAPAVPDQPQGPPAATQDQPTPPATPGWHRFSPQPAPPAPMAAPLPQANPAPVPVPDHMTLPAGTFVTVRVDQYISSDKNKNGDAFVASLARPLVANGLIISRRGATLGGHVVDAKKAGRVSGVSHLQVALNTLTLADGQQVPVETALTSITGTTSNGRDASAIVTTTAAGAIIGGAADWGRGAAIGSGAGLAAGVIGVLVTRGRPTVIYPESQLTFRLAKPVTFSTEKAPQAFADARTLNVQRAATQQRPQGPRPSMRYQGGSYYPPPPYYYNPYPYYWGPSFGFYYGGGFYGHHYGHRH